MHSTPALLAGPFTAHLLLYAPSSVHPNSEPFLVQQISKACWPAGLPEWTVDEEAEPDTP
jgi:hypothetical protein